MATHSRGSTKHSKVLLGLFVLFVLFLGGMWLAYVRLVQYERRAALHVPEGAPFAARLDLEQVVLFEPFRRHVLPVVRDLLAQQGGLATLEEKTGIDLAMDLREVMFARAAREGHWVAGVGGLFPSDGVVSGLYEIVQEAKLPGCTFANERLSCPPYGVFVEQADDGIVVFSSDAQLLVQALAPSEHYERLGLGRNDAAGFGMDGSWLRALPGVRFGALVPGLGALDQFDGASGTVELGTESFVEVRLRPEQGGDLSSLAPTVETLLSGFGTFLRLAGQRDHAGEQALLARAEVTTTETGEVKVRSVWPREDMDRAAQSLGQILELWLRSPPKP